MCGQAGSDAAVPPSAVGVGAAKVFARFMSRVATDALLLSGGIKMVLAQIGPGHGDGFSIIKAFMRFSELGAEWVMYLLMFLGAIMIGLFVQRLLFSKTAG